MDPDLRRLTKKNSFNGEIQEEDTLVNFEVLFAKPENRKHFLKKIFDRIEKLNLFSWHENKLIELLEIIHQIIRFKDDNNPEDFYITIYLFVNLKSLKTGNSLALYIDP